MDTDNTEHDFYLIVHEVDYKGIQRIRTAVINEKFPTLPQARSALRSARRAIPEAYIVGYSYPD